MNQLQRQEPQLPELRPLEIGEAVLGKKLRSTPVEELKQALRLVMLKLGLRAANMPSPEETTVLISHIYNLYPNHTTKEILLAFDMAIAGRLDCDVNCYENFSCAYFSQIMIGYRKWAAEQSKEIKIPLLPDQAVIITQEEKEADIKEWEAKENVNLNLIPPYIYDYLIEFGKIDTSDKKAFNQLKKDAWQKAVNYRESDLRTAAESNFNRDRISLNNFLLMKNKQVEWSEEEYNRIVNLAMKIIVIQYLRSINPKP